MDKGTTMDSIMAAVSGSWRLACGGLLLVLALGGTTAARDSSSDGSDPTFKALLIDGREVAGRIVSFADSRSRSRPRRRRRRASPSTNW